MAYQATKIINGVPQFTNWAPSVNTKAYWPLNGDLLDYSGNGNHLQNTPLTGDTTQTNSPVIGLGKFGNSYFFERTGHNLLWTETLPITPAEKSNWTISFWFKPNDANDGAVFEHGFSGGWMMRHGSGGAQPGLTNVVNLDTIPWPTLNEWHLFTMNRGGGVTTAYIDGISGSTTNSTPINPDRLFMLGGFWFDGMPEWSLSFFEGYICEFIAEKQCWTDQQILDYYNQYK